MRLTILETGHRWSQRLFFKMIKLQMGHVPGPMRVLTYRRSWFGSPFVDCLQQAMRNSKHWSSSEMELFAAFISKLNRCTY